MSARSIQIGNGDGRRALHAGAAPRPRGVVAIAALVCALAVSAAGCSGGGGGGEGAPGTAAGVVAGPGQVLIAGQLVDEAGRPVAGARCTVAPLGPSALATSVAGLTGAEVFTDEAGRFGALLPLNQVAGPNGGRFYRIELRIAEPGAERLRARIDLYVAGSGADLGTLRLWQGAVAAGPVSGARDGGIEVRWRSVTHTHGQTAAGYKPALYDASGVLLAEALITGFADRFTFDPSQIARAPHAATVAANLTRSTGSGFPAYVSLVSAPAPVVLAAP